MAKPTIKQLYRDPSITDFMPDELVINVTDSTLFYKAKSKVYKVLTTLTSPEVDTSALSSSLADTITIHSGSFSSSISANSASIAALNLGFTAFNQEQVEDWVNTLITVGGNMSKTYDDTNNILTLNSTDTQLSQNQVANYANNFLNAGTGIDLSWNLNTNQIQISNTLSVTTQENVEDWVDGLLTEGSNITLTYDDTAGTLSIASTQRGIDDTPVDGEIAKSITSNWAFDHNAGTGNSKHVPAIGSAGEFLKHDGTFGPLPFTAAGISGSWQIGTNIISSSDQIPFTAAGITGSWQIGAGLFSSSAQVTSPFSAAGITGSWQIGAGLFSSSAQIDHDTTNNFAANEHIDWTVSVNPTVIHSDNYTDTVYIHPTYDGDDITVNTGTLTGKTVIDDIHFNITTDTAGHVEDVTLTTLTTRELELTDLGFTSAMITGSYQGDGVVSASNTPAAGTYLSSSGQWASLSVAIGSGLFSSSAQVDHDTTNNFTQSEHVNWTLANQATTHGTIHTDNYVDNDTWDANAITGSWQIGQSLISSSAQLPPGTVSSSGQIDHDATTNFTQSEHVNWTLANQATSHGTIHASNYVDNDTWDASAISGSWQGARDTDGWVSASNAPAAGQFLSSSGKWEAVPGIVDWTTDQGTTNIHENNITTLAVTQQETNINHDNLLNFTQSEHVNWTLANQATTHGTIHASNYVDNDTWDASAISGSWQIGAGLFSSSAQVTSPFSAAGITGSWQIGAGLFSSSAQVTFPGSPFTAAGISGSWQTGSGLFSSSAQVTSPFTQGGITGSAPIQGANDETGQTGIDHTIDGTTRILTSVAAGLSTTSDVQFNDLDIDGTFDFADTGTFNDDITIIEGKKIIFDTTDSFIKSNTETAEDLEIHANQDLLLMPDRHVGIGSLHPSSSLHVYKASTTTNSTTGTTLLTLTNHVGGDLNQQKTFLDFVLTDTNTNEQPQVRIGAEVGPNADANTQQKEGEGAFVVYTNDSTGVGPSPTNLAERFRVDYIGNVGIGTNSPGEKLTVEGNISASGQIFAGLTSATTTDAVFFKPSTGELSYGTAPNNFTAVGISGSWQTGSGLYSSSAQLPAGIISSSTQLPAGTISSSDQLPAGTVSSSGQIDHDQTLNFLTTEHFTQGSITTVGTVTAGDVSAILPSGTISSSAQLPAGTISSSAQFASGISGSFLLNTTDQLDGTLTVTNDITASGNIKTNEIQVAEGNSKRGVYYDNHNYLSPQSHNDDVWIRSDSGRFTFQTHNDADNWTYTYQLHLPDPYLASSNSQLAELGQRTSNATDGTYRGTRIVKYEGSSVVDGDLEAGTGSLHYLTVSGNLIVRPEVATGLTDAYMAVIGGGNAASDATLALKQSHTVGFDITYDGGTDDLNFIGSTGPKTNLSINNTSGKVTIPGDISGSGKLFANLPYGNSTQMVFYTSDGELVKSDIANAGNGLLSSSAQIASDISGSWQLNQGIISSSAQLPPGLVSSSNTPAAGQFLSSSGEWASVPASTTVDRFERFSMDFGNDDDQNFIQFDLSSNANTSTTYDYLYPGMLMYFPYNGTLKTWNFKWNGDSITYTLNAYEGGFMLMPGLHDPNNLNTLGFQSQSKAGGTALSAGSAGYFGTNNLVNSGLSLTAGQMLCFTIAPSTGTSFGTLTGEMHYTQIIP